MEHHLKKNREHWDEVTPVHARSRFYDVKGFEAGKNTLSSIERDELGDVSGKSLLHLQCHFGLDTLSWARLGARVTGVDFSPKAIDLARSLSLKTGIDATFVCSDVHALPQIIDNRFDIVFTSAGVLCWLPDLFRWGEIIAHFLKKGGIFYIFEGHPLLNMYEYGKETKNLELQYSYFHRPEPNEWAPDYDYADKDMKSSVGTSEWTHSLGDVINALIDNGLKVEFLHEFPLLFFQANPLMIRGEDGWWRLAGDRLPLTFSLKATKL